MQPSSIDPAAPPPFLFNAWKHHARVLAARIVHVATASAEAWEAFPNSLVAIGTELMDWYLGEMTPDAIAREVTAYLSAKGLHDAASFHRHLDVQGGYITLPLSDASTWVLRVGETVDRWVHIHPGRYATHTIRVRANVLKTAALVVAHSLRHDGDPWHLDTVNQLRVQRLELSPLKTVPRDKGLGPVLQTLHDLARQSRDREGAG